MKRSYIAYIIIFLVILSVLLVLLTVSSKKTDPNSLSTSIDHSPFLVKEEVIANDDCVLDVDTALESINYAVSMDPRVCTYRYSLVDLNLDGKDESLVYVSDPAWCGTGGCNMLIVDAYNQVLGTLQAVLSPVYIGQELVDGWRPLFIKDGIRLDQEIDTYVPRYMQFNFKNDSSTSGYSSSYELELDSDEKILVDSYEMSVYE